ncbi:MAG: hypothetical protein PHU85_12815 [Phycisphaerae bacterium]|nr:hypothetical protein [Phycisphaerae bacterium]
MKRFLLTGVAAWLALATTATAADPVTFAVKPAVVKAGDAWTISFTLSASSDVEVAVVDAAGKPVRHLAAGVLGGKNPPPPPLKEGLAQAISWDGKDDAGKPVAGGECSARVRAGLGVKFGKIIGASPWTGNVGENNGLAVGPKGELYVKMASMVPQLHEFVPWQLREFDRVGKYGKTHLPYAPSTDPAKAAAFRNLDAGDGLLTPATMSPLDPVTFYIGDAICPRLVDGCVVFVDARGGKLNFVKVDGSHGLKAVPMRSRPDKLKWATVTPTVAFSPDGKFAYYSNLANIPYDPKTFDKLDPNWPQGRVYRHEIGKDGADAEKFFDLPLAGTATPKMWVPNAWNRRSAAAGIDTDAKGNVLVGDLVDQQVVELSPEGKQLSATKVDWPDRLAVSRKTGAIYVVSRKVSDGAVPVADLIKLTGRGEAAKVAAKLAIGSPAGQSIAIDESGDTPVIWVGGGDSVIRIEDRGESLEIVAKPSNEKDAVGFVCFGDVDRQNEYVYVTSGMGPVWRYNGVTGEGGLTPIRACDVAIGPGGMIYGWGNTGSYAGPVARYAPDFKPAPLEATGKNLYGSVFGRFGRGNNAPGMAVDSRGWVYAICGFNDCHMRVYNDKGELAEYDRKATVGEDKTKPGVSAFLAYVLDQGGSIRVDPQFNVYVLEIGLTKAVAAPKGFEKEPAYQKCTGLIYKFSPKGGTFKRTATGWEAEGAIATYTAPCGPISGSWNSTMSVCHCNRPRFDVDPFGRLYVPNGITYKVAVRDNADNEILTFGGYGNFDAQGPASTEPKPEIPVGAAIFSMSTNRSIYIGDYLNHRVVRADKTFAAEATCTLK